MAQHTLPARHLRGIELFNAGQYFEAHEAWEDLWRDARGDERVFYQGMVQAAVTLEHFRRGNLRGATNLWRACRSKLTALPARFMGMNLPAFVAAMEMALGPLLAPNPENPRFDPALSPGIRIDSP